MSRPWSPFDNESIEDRLSRDLQQFDGHKTHALTHNGPWQSGNHCPYVSLDNVCSFVPEPSSYQWQNSNICTQSTVPCVLDSVPFPLEPTSLKDDMSILSDSRSTTPAMDVKSSSTRSYGNDDFFATGEWIPPALAPQSLLGGGSFHLENDGRYVCMECQRSFPTSQSLETHSKSLGHRAYVCTEPGCGRKYPRRDTFVRHMATHKSTELHACRFCFQTQRRKVFKRKDHLAQHMRNRHPTALLGSDNNHLGCDHNGPLLRQTFLASDASTVSPVSSPEMGSCCQRYPNNNSSCQGRELQDVTSALGKILGVSDPAVQLLGQRLEPHSPRQIAQSLARLALFQPNDFESRTKEQLETSVAQSSKTASPPC